MTKTATASDHPTPSPVIQSHKVSYEDFMMTPYAKRVRELEAEGLTTSDAQGCADVEVMRGTLQGE